MSQFDYFATWEDSWLLLERIFASGDITALLDDNYESPTPTHLQCLDSTVREFIKRKRSLFLLSPKFSQTPLRMSRIGQGDQVGRFFVDPIVGGPHLHLTIPACYDDRSMLNLSAGILSYPKRWLNTLTNEWERSTHSLAEGFAEVVKTMKTVLTKKAFEKPVWIGPDAASRVEKGSAVLRMHQ